MFPFNGGGVPKKVDLSLFSRLSSRWLNTWSFSTCNPLSGQRNLLACQKLFFLPFYHTPSVTWFFPLFRPTMVSHPLCTRLQKKKKQKNPLEMTAADRASKSGVIFGQRFASIRLLSKSRLHTFIWQEIVSCQRTFEGCICEGREHIRFKGYLLESMVKWGNVEH